MVIQYGTKVRKLKMLAEYPLRIVNEVPEIQLQKQSRFAKIQCIYERT